MDELNQLDPERFGTFGGPREYSESEGRFGGGGWINSPLAASDADGTGTVAPPPPSDPDGTLVRPGFIGSGPYGASPILDAVERASGPFGRVGGNK